MTAHALIPSLGRLIQGDHDCKGSLEYVGRSCFLSPHPKPKPRKHKKSPSQKVCFVKWWSCLVPLGNGGRSPWKMVAGLLGKGLQVVISGSCEDLS